MAADPFNIVMINPPGFEHTAVFYDVARLLAMSLNSLGHRVAVNVNVFAESAINIVLGYQLLDRVSHLQNIRWIPYQLEQFSKLEEPFKSHWIKILGHATQIWDYDLANISILQESGLTVRHVPLGFHPELKVIQPAIEMDIDVLHYGSVSDRRKRVLQQLHDRCRLQIAFGVYGLERDALIARSKVVLNMHQSEAAIFEQVRVSYLLNNSRCVVSEDATYNPYREMIATANYDGLVERCLQLIEDGKERDAIARQGAQRFEAMPMTQILKNVLGWDL